MIKLKGEILENIIKLKMFLERLDGTNRMDTFKALFSALFVYTVIGWITYEKFDTFDGAKAAIVFWTLASYFLGLFNSISIPSSSRHYIMPLLRDGSLDLSVYIIGTLYNEWVKVLLQSIVGTILFAAFYGVPETGLTMKNTNWEIFITLFLLILSSDMAALLAGHFIDSIETTMVILPLLLISQLLLSHGIFEISENIFFLTDYIACCHGIAALGSIYDINEKPLSLLKDYPMIQEIEPNDLFHYQAEYVLEAWFHLLILLILPIIVQFIVLRYRINKKE